MRLLDKLATKTLTITRVNEPERWGDNWFHRSGASWSADKEIADSYDSYVENAYKSNGIVFACVLARMMPFSEARFLYQDVVDGNPGRLVDGVGLDLLRIPWPNGTTGDLLTHMEQDVSLGGNFYCTPVEGRLRRLRPDWVTIISGVRGDPERSALDLRAEVLGYVYRPPGEDGVLLTPDRVAHYAPIPDPAAQWRGMSWITPVLPEVSADKAMTTHKLRSLKRGANLAYVITYDPDLEPAMVSEHARVFSEQYEGEHNSGKTLHIGGGADPKTIGTTFKDLDFRAVQGAGETRIAAASGVGAIIARFSEGLQGSSLNQGNYEAAKRQVADMTLRPLWRQAAGALAKFTSPGSDQRLWYDTRDVEFLKADRKDAAEIQGRQAETIRTLTDAGYTPESVIRAVEAEDFSQLVHSGLYSIQLQPPGPNQPAPSAD